MIRKRTNYINKTEIHGKLKYLMPCYGGRDIYNYYRKNIRKRIPSKYNINYKQHRDILECYNKKIVNLLIEGYEVKMPSLGFLTIRKKWITNENYNMRAKKKILTEGKWKAFVKFKRNNTRVKNIFFYSFKAGGVFQRKIAAVFATNDGHKRYFEV